MQVADLNKDILNNSLNNIYLFLGPEVYLKQLYIKKIESILLLPQFSYMNKTILEDKFDIYYFIDMCENMPFFSPKRLIIIQNCRYFKQSTNESINKFIDYIKVMPPHNCVIFCENEVDKRLELTRTINKIGICVDFPLQKPADLIKWSVKVYHSLGKQISLDTASLFVHYCKPDMSTILNEIHKVCAFVGENPQIKSKDLDIVSSKSIKSGVFNLIDAISQRNYIQSLQLLRDLVSLGEPIPKILYMISKHFSHILQAKLLFNGKLDATKLPYLLGVSSYAASKFLSLSNKFSIEMLDFIITQILQTDLDIKTSNIKPITSMELLISSICSKNI